MPRESTRRITRSPRVMGGKPCVRGMRVTVGTIVNLLATGDRRTETLALYPYLEVEDIHAVIEFESDRKAGARPPREQGSPRIAARRSTDA